MGQPLVAVEEVREGPAAAQRLGPKALGAVLRMGEGAFARKADPLQPLAVVGLEPAQLRLDVLHEGAVGAEEEHQQRPAAEGRRIQGSSAHGLEAAPARASAKRPRGRGVPRGSIVEGVRAMGGDVLPPMLQQLGRTRGGSGRSAAPHAPPAFPGRRSGPPSGLRPRRALGLLALPLLLAGCVPAHRQPSWSVYPLQRRVPHDGLAVGSQPDGYGLHLWLDTDTSRSGECRPRWNVDPARLFNGNGTAPSARAWPPGRSSSRPWPAATCSGRCGSSWRISAPAAPPAAASCGWSRRAGRRR